MPTKRLRLVVSEGVAVVCSRECPTARARSRGAWSRCVIVRVGLSWGRASAGFCWHSRTPEKEQLRGIYAPGSLFVTSYLRVYRGCRVVLGALATGVLGAIVA